MARGKSIRKENHDSSSILVKYDILLSSSVSCLIYYRHTIEELTPQSIEFSDTHEHHQCLHKSLIHRYWYKHRPLPSIENRKGGSQDVSLNKKIYSFHIKNLQGSFFKAVHQIWGSCSTDILVNFHSPPPLHPLNNFYFFYRVALQEESSSHHVKPRNVNKISFQLGLYMYINKCSSFHFSSQCVSIIKLYWKMRQ